MDNTWAIWPLREIIDMRGLCTMAEDLENEHFEEDADGDLMPIPVDRWPADRREEFAEYQRIIEEVKSNRTDARIDSHGDTVILVNLDFFTEYVRNECNELCGNDFYKVKKIYGQPEPISQSELSDHLPQLDFVNWEAYAENQRKHYAEIEINGITYLYEGC